MKSDIQTDVDWRSGAEWAINLVRSQAEWYAGRVDSHPSGPQRPRAMARELFDLAEWMEREVAK